MPEDTRQANAPPATDHRPARRSWRDLALHDPKIREANNALAFAERLGAVARRMTMTRKAPTGVSVVSLDWVNLKRYNAKFADVSGEPVSMVVGDIIMAKSYRSIVAALQTLQWNEPANGSAFLARTGGDEFALVVERELGRLDMTHLFGTAHAIWRNSLDQPIELAPLVMFPVMAGQTAEDQGRFVHYGDYIDSERGVPLTLVAVGVRWGLVSISVSSLAAPGRRRPELETAAQVLEEMRVQAELQQEMAKLDGTAPERREQDLPLRTSGRALPSGGFKTDHDVALIYGHPENFASTRVGDEKQLDWPGVNEERCRRVHGLVPELRPPGGTPIVSGEKRMGVDDRPSGISQ